jgi:hypothetical protein
MEIVQEWKWGEGGEKRLCRIVVVRPSRGVVGLVQRPPLVVENFD